MPKDYLAVSDSDQVTLPVPTGKFADQSKLSLPVPEVAGMSLCLHSHKAV